MLSFVFLFSIAGFRVRQGRKVRGKKESRVSVKENVKTLAAAQLLYRKKS